MNNNKVFSLDIETSGLNVLNPNFKIFSMAVAYTEDDYSNIQTRYFDNMEDIENALVHLQDKQVLVYNYGYEIYVFKHIFPHIKLNNVVDVMRLSQIKGLPPETKKDQQKFSLKATTKRFLPFYSGYEEKFYEWLRVNKGVKRGKEGAYLCELPLEMLREYNTLDSIVTLKLYFYFKATFAEEGYDWTIDHDLYKLIADYVIEGELNGIRVNREQLQEYVAEIEDEVATIDSKFRFKFKNEIEKVRERLRQKVQAKYKKKIVTELPEFNITSKQHLEMLICDELGLKASITTKTGKPSFKSAHMTQWGDSTKLLVNRGKRLIIQNQAKALLKLSELDNRFHPKLKSVGCLSGRLSGASTKQEYGVSLNIQAIGRQDKKLMSSLVADEGNILVSQDLCFTENTDILTNLGWVKATEITDDMLIWQVDRDNLVGNFIQPLRVIKRDYLGNLITYKTKRGDLTVTEGHRMLFVGQQNHPTRKDKPLYRKDIVAGNEQELTSGCHFSCFSKSISESQWDTDDIDRACALHADGYYVGISKNKKPKYRIEVSRPRKVLECTRLFGKHNYDCPPNSKQNLHRYTWYVEFEHPILHKKEFLLENLGANQVDIFVKCLQKWDGSKSNDSSRTHRCKWSTVKKEEAEKVQIFLVTNGFESRISVHKRENPRVTLYSLSIRKQGCIRFQTRNTPSRTPSGKLYCGTNVIKTTFCGVVGCVEVPSGYIQVRQGGQTFITGNCRGEPTITSMLTGDVNYRRLNVGMDGIKPYFEGDLLISNDQYVSLGFLVPFARPELLNWIERNGGIDKFGDRWLNDGDNLKNEIKKLRKLLKAWVLAIGYSAQPKKLYQTAKEMGFDVEMSHAEATYEAFWSMYRNVKQYADYCYKTMKRKGFMYNPFGFRCVTEPRKAFNLMIQSSLNGVIALIMEKIKQHGEELSIKPITCIHDEILIQLPEQYLEQYRQLAIKIEDEVNAELDWDVRMKLGFATGKSMYEAK